jgi:SAM-dependent methyltransferase
MIIHKLILRHLRTRDDSGFYLLQALDAISWLEKQGVEIRPGIAALDLGCGHGVFGLELMRKGCSVIFADEVNTLLPGIGHELFQKINVDRENVSKLGKHDLVICSNVLEHLARPCDFIERIPTLLNPGGWFYLSWTNWLSPWGGHDFSPFHYFGPRIGHVIYDKLFSRRRIHTPFQTLYPTYIGSVLRAIRRQNGVQIVRTAPRYYTEFAWIMRVPWLREFAAWNCALLLRRPA